MKKDFPSVIDKSAQEHETIIVSGGKVGLQMELAVKDLANITGAELANIV